MDILRHSNVNDLIEHVFSHYATLPAFTCMGKTLTYADIDRRSRIFASYLRHELGLQPGERIAIQLPNILQFPIVFYGAVRAGLIVVNVNPLYTAREVKHQLVNSGAKSLVVLSNVAAAAAEIIDETEVSTVIVTSLGDEHGAVKGPLINFVVKHLKKMVPDASFPNHVAYNDMMKHTPSAYSNPPVSSDDIAVLQYTGGTTGVPKAAMLTQGNLSSNAWQMTSHLSDVLDAGKEVFVACLPMYHIYALQMHALSAFSLGAHNILIPNPRDFPSIVKALKNTSFSIFIGINTLFRGLHRDAGFMSLDFSSLKLSAAGGMAMTEDASKGWEALTGCRVCEGYGLTETSPVLTANGYNKETIHLGTIGTALPETRLKIIDEIGCEVSDGDVGELCAAGPQIMAGYWHCPDATKEVMTDDGFLKTGDMAIKLANNRYKIVDRKKDLILVSGFNVYPNEIEDVLTQHENIIEAAAIGVKCGESGEIVKAFVVVNEKPMTEEDVIAFCRKNLTAYKVPKQVAFVSELPKSNVGKILRRELRDK